MAGTYPTDPKPQSVSIKSNTQTYKSVSQNLSVETRSRGIQRWEISLDYPPMTRNEAMKIYSFIISQQGSFETFQFKLPAPLNQPASIADGTFSGLNSITNGNIPQVTDSRANVSRSIQVGNLLPDGQGLLRAGDLFKFQSHKKIYMVTEDLNAGSVGTGTLKFTPPLLQKGAAGTLDNANVASGGDQLELVDFDMDASLIEDEFEFPIDENVFYTMSVRFGERVNVTTTTT